MNDPLAKFQKTPASSEDECRELLQALVEKYHFEEDSKWVGITEEYNLLASEKKTKQTLKRQAAKFPAPKSVAVQPAGADAGKSNTQKKKEAAAEQAKLAAMRKVAADIPKDEDERAEFISRQTVEHFWGALTAGEFPEQEVEGIFGCKMDKGGPGSVAYDAWGAIVLHSLVDQEEVIEKLQEGTLPESFGSWIVGFPVTSHSVDTLKLATTPALLTKLPWSAEKLKRCAKPSARDEVDASLAVAATPMIASQELEETAEAFAKYQEEQKTQSKQSKQSNKSNQSKGAGKASGYPASGESALSKLMTKDSIQAMSKESISKAGMEELEKLTKELKQQRDEAPKTGEGQGYSWSQQDEEIELVIPVDKGLAKKDIKVNIKAQAVVMEAPKSMKLELHSPLLLDGCGWTLSNGQVVITLEKKKPGLWPSLLKK